MKRRKMSTWRKRGKRGKGRRRIRRRIKRGIRGTWGQEEDDAKENEVET